MRPWALLALTLMVPLPVGANHGWSEIDLCEVYKDRLSAGPSADALAETGSEGAVLLDRYCSQCHNLPGPDRHTAAEWRDVAPRMLLLMDVAHRFRGIMGRVEAVSQLDQKTLPAYLERHGAEVGGGEPKVASEAPNYASPTRSLVLSPLLLVGLGVVRWRRRMV